MPYARKSFTNGAQIKLVDVAYDTDHDIARPWTHPIPDGNYSSSLVQHHELDYGPSFLSSLFPTWSRTDLYNFADAEPRFLGLFGSMPSWSTTVQGMLVYYFCYTHENLQELTPILRHRSRHPNFRSVPRSIPCFPVCEYTLLHRRAMPLSRH